MNNHLEYFDNCPVGTVYETTVDYGPELVGETSVWKFLYKLSVRCWEEYDTIYKYVRVE